MADTPVSSASTGSTSPYFRRRFDAGTTRREAMEHRFGKGKTSRASSGSDSSPPESRSALHIPDPASSDHEPQSPPRLAPKSLGMRPASVELHGQGTTFLDHSNAGVTSVTTNDTVPSTAIESGNDQHSSEEETNQPQHLQNNEKVKYYRVVYRGVVALLGRPSELAPRSGAYISYGDVIASSEEIIPNNHDANGPATPTRNTATKQPLSPSRSSATSIHKLVRVDRVLTGGYTVDAVDSPVEPTDRTPKRGNTQVTVAIVGPSPLPLSGISDIGDPQGTDEHTQPHGYTHIYRKEPILVQIVQPPKCEYGSFMYRVVSSTPLAIHTGPCADAPRTKGMLVPGTVHEVCLRVVESSVSYLRLTRRRGWVVDRMEGASGKGMVVMKDVTFENSNDDCNLSVASVSISSIATPVSVTRQRHRPPRRKRERKADLLDQSMQSRHDGQSDIDSHLNQSVDRGLIMSPSSNVSLLSDESSLDHSNARHPGAVTPDRSVARSTASSSLPSHPTVYLMRVNAPRGLKILDAPHFQVSNLIHGSQPSHNVVSPTKENPGKTGNVSIFQTMGGNHTTAPTSKMSNPVVFDSNTKARRLPRGAVFEASKRMEPPGAFSQGAGLIKLSDNSGWAIVPRREELDDQYRNYTGSLTGVKEGEATRAFEEVGNAVMDDHGSPIYVRVLTKGGVAASLHPSSIIGSDDETSPTSSAGGSSAISGSAAGSSSLVRGHDSDVASSVGSSFLDAVFRTPRKRDVESSSNDGRKDAGNGTSKGPPMERLPFSPVIPCGMVVEVERWASSSEGDEQSRQIEFARIRGGQGWIPLNLNGKTVAQKIKAPETRFGSFWFRVQDRDGIKVRLGPSKRAPSIKSEDGIYFRFECGEFLRASEIVTFFQNGLPVECYAKLYRNRHVRLYSGHGLRPLGSLTVQSEWVQVFIDNELFLEECAADPRIERHRQGWRYNVVLDARVPVRKGPSFDAETNGAILLGGESVLVNERVTGPDDSITWLRLRDGKGWVHNFTPEGEALMIPHSIRHRKGPPGRPTKAGKEHQEDIAYNTIIARLFHNDLPQDRSSENRVKSKRRWN